MSKLVIISQIADKLLGIVERFLDPKQYDIVRMKRVEKALNFAEQEFELTGEIIRWVGDNMELFPDKVNEIDVYIKQHNKLKKKFNKYD